MVLGIYGHSSWGLGLAGSTLVPLGLVTPRHRGGAAAVPCRDHRSTSGFRKPRLARLLQAAARPPSGGVLLGASGSGSGGQLCRMRAGQQQTWVVLGLGTSGALAGV